jgi:hypothetical protein
MAFDSLYDKLILEVMDTDIPVEWDTDALQDGLILGQLTAPNGIRYVIELTKMHDDAIIVEGLLNKYLWRCKASNQKPVSDITEEIKKANVWSVEFYSIAQKSAYMKWDSTKTGYDILGTGGAFGVFSAVIHGLMDITLEYPNIKVLEFTADEPSRRSLYSRLVKQTTSKLGWGYQELEDNKEKQWLLY